MFSNVTTKKVPTIPIEPFPIVTSFFHQCFLIFIHPNRIILLSYHDITYPFVGDNMFDEQDFLDLNKAIHTATQYGGPRKWSDVLVKYDKVMEIFLPSSIKRNGPSHSLVQYACTKSGSQLNPNPIICSYSYMVLFLILFLTVSTTLTLTELVTKRIN